MNYQIYLLLIKIFPVTWFLGFPWKSGLYLRTTSPACENIPHPSAVSGNTFRPRYLGTKGSWFFFIFIIKICVNVSMLLFQINDVCNVHSVKQWNVAEEGVTDPERLLSYITQTLITMVADCGANCARWLLCLANFVFIVSATKSEISEKMIITSSDCFWWCSNCWYVACRRQGLLHQPHIEHPLPWPSRAWW